MDAPKTYRFSIYNPGEYSAGIRSFHDRIRVTVDSGNPGGEKGDFEKYMQECLQEWYDGSHVFIGDFPEELL